MFLIRFVNAAISRWFFSFILVYAQLFRYLTGVRVPGCAYILHKTAKGKPRRVLFMERRSEYQKLWEGDLPPDSELEGTAEFDELLSPSELPQVKLSLVASIYSL